MRAKQMYKTRKMKKKKNRLELKNSSIKNTKKVFKIRQSIQR